MTEAQLHTRALRLSYFTVVYNVLEDLVSVAAGMLAGSVALVGFGLDGFVESLSGGIMIWRFGGRAGHSPDWCSTSSSGCGRRTRRSGC